ncbi:hypothetical protein [Pseudodesulfovibrio portus]|uniref:Uncharacterized protein n=1 Tax=Pseudodesulfovibrio portus TaxID=231439 RepID=A0ABM8AW53_9BACT|nr:hypothetical protein [Pseudodesulfovibrio portus]BDQ35486.1 hypothetical protein JCM14722_30280 [Pseudodesulfovibrio portus]
MTNATETIDRRDLAHVEAEELPRANVWMETNLAWNPDFWDSLRNMTLMRLNPHWHMDKFSDGTYPVEDVLVESEFNVAPRLSRDGGTFTAAFPEIGLTLSARSCDKGTNTAVSFAITPARGASFTVEDAQRTMQYWLPSLREYYRLYESDSLKHRTWRFFMNKILLTMNPTQRRICGFMFKLTVLECLLILILGVGWFYYGA